MHSRVGCNQAPRPGNVADGSTTDSPFRTTILTKEDLSARCRQPRQVLTGSSLAPSPGMAKSCGHSRISLTDTAVRPFLTPRAHFSVRHGAHSIRPEAQASRLPRRSPPKLKEFVSGCRHVAASKRRGIAKVLHFGCRGSRGRGGEGGGTEAARGIPEWNPAGCRFSRR